MIERIVRAQQAALRKAAAIAHPNLTGLEIEIARQILKIPAQHGQIPLVLTAEEAKFGLDVFCHILVIIQMIGRDVQEHAHARAECGAGLQLKAGDLKHQHIGLAAGKNIFGKRRADIAAQKNRVALGLEHGGRPEKPWWFCRLCR